MPKKSIVVRKPWGKYEIMEKTKTHWLKKLYVNKKARLSTQSHNLRSEVWIVLKGKIKVQKGNRKYTLDKGDIIKINKKEKHRIESITNSCIIEIALGNVKESDIIRYQDDYGRIK